MFLDSFAMSIVSEKAAAAYGTTCHGNLQYGIMEEDGTIASVRETVGRYNLFSFFCVLINIYIQIYI